MAEVETGGVDTPIEDWYLRPWILAGLLAIAGLLIFFLTDGRDPEAPRAAGTAFVLFGSLAAAFTLGPQRLRDPAIFALGIGLVMAGLAWHWVRVQDSSAGEEFALAAGVFATGLALPLFQAGFHRTRFATSYELTHFHVWTDVVTAAGALAFTGLSWLLLALLNGLFDLVGIGLLDALMDEEWFGWTFSGASFGAGLGVLRNNLKIIGNLQNVVLLVLSLLAVPLALGLAVFLVALLASGGQALWDATDAATPVLLACAIGCFVLTCAVMREDDGAMTRNRVQRWAAMLLGYGIFPLAVFAAISMGIRIDQHGLSPERIWALIAIAVAVAYGVAYWAGLIRGRLTGWPERLRRANLHLAALTCVLALILALPWHDFGAISTRDQLARLESGEVSPEDFDYAALKWDFGDAGREALDELAAGEGKIARLAIAARDAEFRPGYWQRAQRNREIDLRVESEDPAVEQAVRNYLRQEAWRCQDFCVVLDEGVDAEGVRMLVLVQSHNSERLVLLEGDDGLAVVKPANLAEEVEIPQLKDDSEVEIREVVRSYVYIDGKRQNYPIPDVQDVELPVAEVAE